MSIEPEDIIISPDGKRIGYNAFEKIQGNPVISGYLDLRGCTGLTVLPDNLSVSGDLYLSGCTGLTVLPDNLSVSGYLDTDLGTFKTVKEAQKAFKKKFGK